MTEERPPLGGRYAVQRPLEQSSERFFAVDVTTGKRVVVALVDAGRLATLESARGVRHRHLAGVLDILREFDKAALPAIAAAPGGAVAVIAEHVPGRTLRAQLAQSKLNPAKAVAWTLRIAEALQGLHSAHAVHGAVSPLSVIAEPAGRAIAPVLSQLVAPPLGSFCPPERLKGAQESASDDVWGLYATLYAALTGSAPFKASTRESLLKVTLSKPKPLAAFGVEEPILQEILQRGMLPDRHARASDLGELIDVLDGWERDPERAPSRRAPAPRPGLRGLGDIVGGTLGQSRNDGVVVDDESLPDDQGVDLPDASPGGVVLPLGPAGKPLAPSEKREPPEPSFPSLPGAAAPSSPVATSAPDVAPARDSSVTDTGPRPPLAAPIPKRPSINPFERKRSIWPWVIVAAIAGGGGVYLAVAPSTPEVPKSAEPPPAPVKPKPKPAATAKRDPAELRDACVTAHFPSDSFEEKQSFAFVCEETDFVAATSRLHGMVKVQSPSDAGMDASPPLDVVRAGSGKAPPPSVGLGLDWYELPATAIIKKTCCPGSTPVTLPETTGWCEQLETVVRRVADDSQRSVDLAPGARAFDKAVTCLFANRIQHPYTYTKVPSAANRAAFQQFLSRAAVIGARR